MTAHRQPGRETPTRQAEAGIARRGPEAGVAPRGPEARVAPREPEARVARRETRQSAIATYVGIAFAVVGFAAIGLAWNGAAELDYIQGQFPFFVSGGLAGLGLILVGLTILLIDTTRRDSAERAAQMAQLTATVAALSRRLAPPDPHDPEATGRFRPRPRVSGNGPGAQDTKQLPTVEPRSRDAGG